ncbi:MULTISPECIES: amino acid permease [unclassified Luteibacter]|uniref:APC family permease n=1 Tax=unclassified Luteibacter TaxID=2620188 RepID=UPI0008B115A1|nr:MULTISPECIES: amino acid permease [unclassified Luteibacter]MDR6936789.1 APA family basic amino acid/polyamine antiporter [Luteibacter sp. 3190]SEW17533.1 amino acid/polyamine/organocation transporter, APC superfamily [Luteibacter sp. 329MFSha]
METTTYARRLTLMDAALIVVGGIIGGGIFLNPGIAAQRTDSGLVLLALWVGGGLLTLIGCLCYAELGARRPEAGGSYVYLREAFGKLAGFLFGWTMLLVIYSGSAAAVATIFGSYATNVFGLSPTLVKPLAVGALVFVTGLNLFGIRFGAQVQNVFAILKLTAIAVLVVTGLAFAGAGTTQAMTPSPEHVAGSLAGALLPVLFAFSGFSYLNNLAGEVRDPQRTLPRALILGMLVVIAAYVLTNYAYLAVLGHDGLATSQAPAADVMSRVFGGAGAKLIAIGIAISTLGFCNITLVAGARVLQVMGDDGLFFASVAKLHPRYRTPNIALMALSVWAIVLVLVANYGQLLDFATFGDWAAYAVTIATLFWYRRHSAGRPAFVTPAYPLLPLTFLAVVIAVVVAYAWDKPASAAVVCAVVLAGLPVYAVWRHLFSKVAR